MAHAIWSGSLSFGLVNIPVNLYSASKPQALNFNLLRKEDLSPIKYIRVARADGKEVPYEDIVRGYEYRKGDYVVLSEDEFKKADIKKTETIEIVDFVDESEIDPIYYEKPYYLEPTRGAAKPYALLAESLKRSNKVGIARFVMRTREHIGVVRPHGDTLIVEQLRYDSEIRPIAELVVPTVEVSAKTDKEIEMAIKLIDQMTEHFNPEDYKDTYNAELLEMIEEKAEIGTVKPRSAEPKVTDFANLMEELKNSLKVAQGTK